MFYTKGVKGTICVNNWKFLKCFFQLKSRRLASLPNSHGATIPFWHLSFVTGKDRNQKILDICELVWLQAISNWSTNRSIGLAIGAAIWSRPSTAHSNPFKRLEANEMDRIYFGSTILISIFRSTIFPVPFIWDGKIAYGCTFPSLRNALRGNSLALCRSLTFCHAMLRNSGPICPFRQSAMLF